MSNIAKYVLDFPKHLIEYFSSKKFPKITQIFIFHSSIAP